MSITIWKKLNAKCAAYEHNHISDDYDENATAPTAISVAQEKAWRSADWIMLCGFNIDGVVYTAREIENCPALQFIFDVDQMSKGQAS